MPYISIEDRDALLPQWNEGGREAMTPGELNFQITALIDGYVAGNLDYQAINDVLGALEGAKLEFYRRIAVPYEEHKRAINGDVYVTKVPIAKRVEAGMIRLQTALTVALGGADVMLLHHMHRFAR